MNKHSYNIDKYILSIAIDANYFLLFDSIYKKYKILNFHKIDFIKNCITFIGHDFHDRLQSRNEGNDIFFNYIVY